MIGIFSIKKYCQLMTSGHYIASDDQSHPEIKADCINKFRLFIHTGSAYSISNHATSQVAILYTS